MKKERGNYTTYSQTTEYKEKNIGMKGPIAAHQNILLLNWFLIFTYTQTTDIYWVAVSDTFIFIL